MWKIYGAVKNEWNEEDEFIINVFKVNIKLNLNLINKMWWASILMDYTKSFNSSVVVF